jgi:hypothetical protein
MKNNTTYRPRWNGQQLEALRRAELRREWDNPNGIESIKRAVETMPFTHNFHDLLFLLDEKGIKVETGTGIPIIY